MFEVNKQSKEETKYPVTRRHRLTKIIVLFWSEHHGVVIFDEDNVFGIGYTSTEWTSCNYSKDWERIDLSITG